MTYSELFELFIRDRETYCSSKTISTYRIHLDRFRSFCVSSGIDDMGFLTTDILKEYLRYLRESGIKATSIQSYFRHLKALLSYAIDNNYIEPFKYKIKLPRPDAEQVLPLSQQEVDHIISTIYNNYRYKQRVRALLIIRLMVDMGMRSSEVRHLRKKDITDTFITIVNSKCNKSRMLPIPPDVKDLLDHYMLYRYSPDDYIIPMSESSLKSFFSRLKESSGIDRLHAHLLRHTFATSYIIKRSNLEYLRCYMGHETYAVTQGYIKMASQCNLIHYDIYKISDVFL